MGIWGKTILASAVTVGFYGVAQAADLPGPLAPIVPPAAATYCPTVDAFFTTDCALTYYGITVYGTVDIGAGYETHGAPFNPYIVSGVSELIRKNSTGGRFLATPNGLSQSNFGIKGEEKIAPGFDFVFDLNLGFNPYSLTLANGPRSLAQNDGVPLAAQTSNADSSRAGQFYNTTGYAGIKSAQFGTLTFGHQYSLELDAVNSYDPMGGSYAFSVIGWQGTAIGGGDTEDARVTSVKYRATIGDDWFRVAALAQIGGYGLNNATQASYSGQIGKDVNLGQYGAFSGDVIYTYDKGAVAAAGLTAAQNAIFPGTLAATISDDQSVMLVGKYTYKRVKLFAGYEFIDFADPSSPVGAGGFTGIAGIPVTFVTQNAFAAHDEHLQIMWVGARYAFTSAIDAGVAYYHYNQNSYGATYCTDNSSGKCAGQLNAVSFNVDWRLAPKLDVYAGMMYSTVSNGLANGYLHTANVAPTAGLRFKF